MNVRTGRLKITLRVRSFRRFDSFDQFFSDFQLFFSFFQSLFSNFPTTNMKKLMVKKRHRNIMKTVSAFLDRLKITILAYLFPLLYNIDGVVESVRVGSRGW